MDRLNNVRFCFIIILALSCSSVANASDDFPYGCHIYYDGADRIYTDYLSTDETQSRHYSPTKSYVAGNTACEVSFAYSSPFGGGCTVEGINTGQNVTITTVEDCPLDGYLTLWALLGGIMGVLALNKDNFRFRSKKWI